MRNQPTYKFFKNFGYAREGLAEIFKNEKSFRIEICIFLIATISLFFWKFDLIFNLFLIFSMAFVLVCECLNSGLERVTDLASPELSRPSKGGKGCWKCGRDDRKFLMWRALVRGCVL